METTCKTLLSLWVIGPRRSSRVARGASGLARSADRPRADRCCDRGRRCLLDPVAAELGGRRGRPDRLRLLVRYRDCRRRLLPRHRRPRLLGDEVPREAGRPLGRAADARPHGDRDRVDGDPDRARDGDLDRERDRARAEQPRRRQRVEHQGRRAAVRLAVHVSQRAELREPAHPDGPPDAPRHHREGRPALVLGAAAGAEAGRRSRPAQPDRHHAEPHRHVPRHLHGALRSRPRDHAQPGRGDESGGVPEVGAERRQVGGERGSGSRRLQQPGLQRLPHVHRRRVRRADRAEPGQAAGGGEGSGEAAQGVHPRIDPESERVHRAELPGRRHAVVQGADPPEGPRRARAVSVQERKVMTAVAHSPQHELPPSRPSRPLTSAGWVRVLWTTPLFFALGMGLVVLIRWLAGWDPLLDREVILTVELVAVPLGFLVGLGGFDYWAYYATGKVTRAEDHSGHGAHSWRDYFRVNTDHKVIGVQYVVTTIFFFCCGGLLAMLFRAELAQPGTQYFNPQTFNVLISEHAALMIFLFIIPALAGLGNYVIPLMIGAADMAFPRLNALSFWLLPIAGIMLLV